MADKTGQVEDFLEKLPLGIVVLDGEGKVRNINQLALNLLGLAVEDLLLDNAEETINQHLSVGELMTPAPISVPGSLPVKEAAELFSSHNFQSLPVVEEGKLVGIITTRDLIKYLGKELE